jgi:Transposase.
MSKKYLRQRRTFSPTLRKEVVRLIESGKLSVTAATREYQVSTTSIYRWIHRYSTYNKKGAVLVVDKDSQTEKLNQLQQKIAELEQAVGHKQMQIDYYKKFIDLASEEVGEDLKKSTTPLLRVVLRQQRNRQLDNEDHA